MNTPSSLAALVLAAALSLPAQQNPTFPKETPDPERERIEREIQGVWEVRGCENPAIGNVLKVVGYMIASDGWMVLNVIVSSGPDGIGNEISNYQGTTKRYVVTPLRRLRVTDAWGFNNSRGVLTMEPVGTAEERVIRFSGTAGIGQSLRIQRAPNDWMEFVRKNPLPPIPTPVISDK